MKIIALMLSILMLASLLLSCADNTEEPLDTSASESSSDTEKPSSTKRPKSTKEPLKIQNQDVELTDENTVGARIMSFNIRYDEFTPERIELVLRMIDTYKPDSIGFQEATDEWMATLEERLGDKYAYVGCGRNSDKKGEACPVFYLKSRFKVIESDTKWLSNTPDVAGSKISSSSLPRIFTYAVLEEIESGKKFAHVNTHLDHMSEDARVKQAEILLTFLKSFEDNNISYALSGDFNDKSSSKTYSAFSSYGLVNSATFAADSEPGDTYHGYGTTAKVIDFIFLNPYTASADYYKACTDTFTDGEGNIAYPSDHNPIVADIKILGKA